MGWMGQAVKQGREAGREALWQHEFLVNEAAYCILERDSFAKGSFMS